MSLKTKLIPVLTEAGKQAVFKADTANIEVNIKYIGVGSGQYEPTADRTSLQDEKLRVEILSSSVDKTNYQMTLNTIFKDEESEFYINEFGIYLDDGTLFAVWSSTEKTLAYKSIWSKPIFAFTLKIVDVNLDAINIIDNGLDLKLNYLTEFTSFGLSMQKLNLLLIRVFNQIRELKQSGADALEAFKKVVVGEVERIDKRYNDRAKEVDSLLVANAIGIIRAMRVELERKDALKKYVDERYGVTLANSIAIVKINQREVN